TDLLACSGPRAALPAVAGNLAKTTSGRSYRKKLSTRFGADFSHTKCDKTGRTSRGKPGHNNSAATFNTGRPYATSAPIFSDPFLLPRCRDCRSAVRASADIG